MKLQKYFLATCKYILYCLFVLSILLPTNFVNAAGGGSGSSGTGGIGGPGGGGGGGGTSTGGVHDQDNSGGGGTNQTTPQGPGVGYGFDDSLFFRLHWFTGIWYPYTTDPDTLGVYNSYLQDLLSRNTNTQPDYTYSAPAVPIMPIAQTTVVLDNNTNNNHGYLQGFIKRGSANDANDIRKLQQFFRDHEGFTNIEVTGFYDQATFNAVFAFQRKYSEEILKPWGYTEPTGVVYILTKKKINEIVLGEKIILTDAENQEIKSYRTAFLASLEKPPKLEEATVKIKPIPTTASDNVSNIAPVTPPNPLTSNEQVVNRKIFDTVSSVASDVKMKSFASSVFSLPHGEDIFEAIVLFMVIVLSINVVATYLGRRALIFSVGSALAILGVSVFGREYLVVPLAVIFVVSAALFLKKTFAKEKGLEKNKIAEKQSQPQTQPQTPPLPQPLILPMQMSAPMLDDASEEDFMPPELTPEDVKELTKIVEQETKIAD